MRKRLDRNVQQYNERNVISWRWRREREAKQGVGSRHNEYCCRSPLDWMRIVGAAKGAEG